MLQILGQIQLSWFDLLVTGMVGFGMYQGRKKGMSQIMLDVCQWLAIVVLAAIAYRPIGEQIANSLRISLLSAYIAGYLWVVIMIKLFFSYLNKRTKGQLVSVDFFGGMEYYLGMFGGSLRVACIFVVCLAVLHARQYTAVELNRTRAFQEHYFGSIRFPTLGELQQHIFHESFSGQMAVRYLGGQLIVPTARGQTAPKKTLARKREEDVMAVMMGFGKH